VYTAEAATMRRFLRALDEQFGGAEQWALDHGLAPDVLDQLRTTLRG
jgi:hypothetical protein